MFDEILRNKQIVKTREAELVQVLEFQVTEPLGRPSITKRVREIGGGRFSSGKRAGRGALRLQ